MSSHARHVRWPALGLAALLSLAAVGCQGKGANEGAPSEDLIPTFTGKTLAGDYLALSDFRGKVVLLNVWATWCGPCREELPELRRLHHEYSDKGFTVLGVSVDKERDARKVEALIRRFDLDYPIIHDAPSSAVGTFNIRGYPTTLLLDRTGTIKWRRDGLIRKSDEAAIAHIEAALGG